MESVSTIGIATERFDRMVCSRCDSAMDIIDVEPFSRVECPNCGHPATVPAKLGNFLLLDLVGTGGMGGVFIAEDESLDRLVAIKIMLKKLGDNAASVETFRREAQAAAKLNHPGIAQIYSIGQEGGQPYIVMELVAGQSLDELIDPKKPLGEALVMRIAMGVAQALNAAQEINLIHGDIKPENILLDEKGRPKLVDFGLASFADQAAAEGIWGTPYYIAPEKVQGHKADFRSDIYSLGATIFHALSAKPPFDGETPTEVVKARLMSPAPRLRRLRGNISQKTEAIVARMLETDPARRYPTYASLIGDMQKVCGTIPMERTARLKNRPRRNLSLSTERLPRVTQNIGPAAADLPPGVRPKVILRTKKSKLSRPAMESYGRQSRSRQAKQLEKGPSAGKREASRAHAARRRRRVLVVLLTFVVLAAVGSLSLYVYGRKQSAMDRRREVVALQNERATAEKLYTDVRQAVADISSLAVESTQLVASVTNSVSVVLDMPYTDGLITAARDDTSGESDVNGDADATSEDAAAETPNAAGATAAPEKDKSDTTTNIQPDADFLVGKLEDMDVRALARVVLGVRDFMPGVAKAAATNAVEAEVIFSKGSQIAQSSGDARVAVVSLEKKREAVQTLLGDASKAVQRARDAAGLSARLARDAHAARAATLLQQRRDGAAQEAANEAARRAEEHRIKVEADRASIAQTRADCFGFVQKGQFSNAFGAAKTAAAIAQTEEGRTGFAVLAERYRRLQELKTFIILRLNTDPEPWIWGNGPTAKDVTRADEDGIQIRGGVRATWGEVSIAQMLKFINVYTSGRRIRLRDQCTHLLNAAIFCIECGGGDQATVAARRYADRAVSICKDLEGEADRLLDFGGGGE